MEFEGERTFDHRTELVPYLKSTPQGIPKSICKRLLGKKSPQIIQFQETKIVPNGIEGEESSHILIKLEKIKDNLGDDLRERRETNMNYTFEEILKIGLDVLEGLKYFMKKGMKHGALSLDNIFIALDKYNRPTYKIGGFLMQMIAYKTRKEVAKLKFDPQREMPSIAPYFIGNTKLDLSDNQDVYDVAKLLLECIMLKSLSNEQIESNISEYLAEAQNFPVLKDFLTLIFSSGAIPPRRKVEFYIKQLRKKLEEIKKMKMKRERLSVKGLGPSRAVLQPFTHSYHNRSASMCERERRASCAERRKSTFEPKIEAGVPMAMDMEMDVCPFGSVVDDDQEGGLNLGGIGYFNIDPEDKENQFNEEMAKGRLSYQGKLKSNNKMIGVRSSLLDPQNKF